MNRANLLDFAREVIATWPDCDLDSEHLQSIAVRHGLLIPEWRTQPCASFAQCRCAQHFADFEMKEGFTCYRKARCLIETPDSCQPAKEAP